MKKIFGYIIIYILLSAFSRAEYYLLQETKQILARQTIGKNDYIILSDGVYKKDQYYEIIYDFPQKINYAEFKENHLRTDKNSYIFTEKKIITDKAISPTKLKSSSLKEKLPVKTKITQYYIINDLDQDGTTEIVFKLNNRLFIGRVNDKIITNSATDGEDDTELKLLPNNRLRIHYRNKDHFFRKEKNVWIKEAASRASPLEENTLKDLSAEELELLRFEIAARHGKIFNNPETQSYFSAKPWYKPDPKFSEKGLTQIELNNIKLLYKLEGEKRRGKLKDKPKIMVPKQ